MVPHTHLITFASMTFSALRIDNSRRGRIHVLWNISKNTIATTSCDISYESANSSAHIGTG